MNKDFSVIDILLNPETIWVILGFIVYFIIGYFATALTIKLERKNYAYPPGPAERTWGFTWIFWWALLVVEVYETISIKMTGSVSKFNPFWWVK